MRFPWSAIRVSCLVASAAASGYFWRGAFEDPSIAQQITRPVEPGIELGGPVTPDWLPDVRVVVPGARQPQPGPQLGAKTRRGDGTAKARPARRPRPTAAKPAARPARAGGGTAKPSFQPAAVAPAAKPATLIANTTPNPAAAATPPKPVASTPPTPKPKPVVATPAPKPKPKPKPEPEPKPKPTAPPPTPPEPVVTTPTPPPAATPAEAVTPTQTVPVAPPSQPAPVDEPDRPGWGHGDKNHDHTGPPGQAKKP